MGVEADDLHLSDLINGRTEGNILNQQALLNTYEQSFSVQDNKCEFTKKLHLWTLIRYAAGTLQNAIIIHLGRTILLARWWRVRQQLLRV